MLSVWLIGVESPYILFFRRLCLCHGNDLKRDLVINTLSPANNEFGYNKHLATTSKFLCIKTIDCNVKKFSCNEHPLVTSSFFCICLLVLSNAMSLVSGFFVENSNKIFRDFSIFFTTNSLKCRAVFIHDIVNNIIIHHFDSL